jgi:hypothetical protein
MSNPVITVEFDLPIGYTDKNGKTHTHVVMRKVKNSDIIAVQQDKLLQDLMARSSAMDLKIDPKNPDPVKSLVINGIILQVFGLIFSRVIISLGDIPGDDVNKSVINDLYQEDTYKMMSEYAICNGMSAEELASVSPFPVHSVN